MAQIPEKPIGSEIEDVVDASGVTYSWPIGSRSVRRSVASILLALWLCGWAYGWFTTFTRLMTDEFDFFLVSWLALWTVIGALSIWTLWDMVRPSRPERIRLEEGLLNYDPGRVPGYGYLTSNWGLRDADELKRSAPTEVLRSAIGRFVLERVGERQRLYFDHGADRVEIGATLREPEREWLYAILVQWHTSSGLA